MKKAKKKITRSTKKVATKKDVRKKDVLSDDTNFIIRHISLPLVTLDAKGIVRNCNSGFVKLFGDEKSESADYVGKSYFKILSDLHKKNFYSTKVKASFESAIKKALKGNAPSKHLEYEMGENWYWSNINAMYSKNQFHGLVISHHNATTWKMRELILEKEKNQSLETSQRKMFFLANLNHELKSPLNAILGFSQLLREQFEKDENLYSYCGMIENIIEGGNHLNSIVFRILNMAKIESGTLTLQEERVMPAKLIQLSLNIVQPLYPERQIQIEICKHAAMETLKCDKNLTMEVLINLIVNSLKFSASPIHVKCTVNDNRNLEFHVRDQGMGMTDDEIHVALEPFGQNLRSPNDKNTGLGLGVPFCNQIMKLHGGDLKIKSEKGKGTTVLAVFPSNRIDI